MRVVRSIMQKLKGYLAKDFETDKIIHLLYLGFITKDGVCQFATTDESGAKVTVNVRNFLFEQEYGVKVIPKSLKRTCDNPRCVAPWHQTYR